MRLFSKSSLVVLMTVFAFLMTAGFLLAQENTAPAKEKAESEKQVVSTKTPEYIFYFFHVTKECGFSKRIEAMAKDCLDKKFSKQVKDGRLQWRKLNTDLKENKHFIKDYKLDGKAIVLVETASKKDAKQRFKNLEEMWKHVKDELEFKKFIAAELSLFIGGNNTKMK